MIQSLVRLFTSIVLIGLWAVIGILLWIPFIFRIMLSYFAAVVVSVYRGRDIAGAEQALNYAITFYSRGFSRIYNSIYARESENTAPAAPGRELDVWKSILDVLFAVAFWAALSFIFGINPVRWIVRGPLGWFQREIGALPAWDFNNATVRMNWEENHLLAETDHYSVRFNVQRLVTSEKNYAFWHPRYAALELLICNVGTQELDDDQELYVWLDVIGAKRIKWDFEPGKLASGGCVTLTESARAAGLPATDSMHGTMSFSPRSDEALARLRFD